MAPKKKDAKSEKGQQKAEQKAKMKVVEDKTFGLKNKNKSKSVQKFIKGLANSAQGQHKGGDTAALAKKTAEKEEKKQSAQQAALLASLFKGTENIKKIEVDNMRAYDPNQSRAAQKMNLYTDQREQKAENEMDGWDMERLEQVIEQKHAATNANATSIVCKHFLDAVERRQYGWFWICPNGGDACKYRHCLPPGYVLKAVEDENEDDEEDEMSIEEIIEEQRAALPAGGTPVTLETFTAWREKKETGRLAEVEAQRASEAKRTGGRGLHVLSGKDLFTYDPTLFVDDEGAAAEDDYNEDEDWQQAVEENQKQIAQDNADAKNQKREDAVEIRADLFLDDAVLPDDLDDLDD